MTKHHYLIIPSLALFLVGTACTDDTGTPGADDTGTAGTDSSTAVPTSTEDSGESESETEETEESEESESEESESEESESEESESEESESEESESEESESEESESEESESEESEESTTESEESSDTDLGFCGDGFVDPGEACDLGDANADTGECTTECAEPTCGDGFVWTDHEECDDGGQEPGDGCSEACFEEWCTWDIDQLDFPLPVHPGFFPGGDMIFDEDCDILVTSLLGNEILRVSQVDGDISQVAGDLPWFETAGLALDPDSGQLYVAGASSFGQIYAVGDMGELSHVADLPDGVPTGMTVAPESFGDYGGHVIVTLADGPVNARLYAVDPETGDSTQLGPNLNRAASPRFSPAGKLYVALATHGRIDSVSPDGVLTPEYTNLAKPEGLAFSPDGTRIVVAQWPWDPGRVDELLVADGTLLATTWLTVHWDYASTGLLIDAAGHVLVKTLVNQAVILEGVAGAP